MGKIRFRCREMVKITAESFPIFKEQLKHISSIFIWPSNSSTLYSNSILSILSSFFIKKDTFDPLSIAYLISNC